MRLDLCPLTVTAVFASCIVLQLALGITWGRYGKVGHVRSENPRRYWLDILVQTIVFALITTFILRKR